jgi:dTDP-L-rhamnose 4-epimerase
MPEHVLITGGAGFIGSRVAVDLLEHGCRVRALDNLTPQVHGREAKRPSSLDRRVELLVGDVRDRPTVERALEGVDAVLHLAAAVGVGQSMYALREYTDVNDVGTAVLLEAMAAQPPRRLVVASSMSIYGEGAYVDVRGRLSEDADRPLDALRAGRWEPIGADGSRLEAVATPEGKRPALASVYALDKYHQERMCLMVGRAYGIPTTALRFFNVYGPGQSLSNPYTGVLAIFASRILLGRPPLVFEDGQQRRDFVSVHDVARACRLALEKDHSAGLAINIGSGTSCTVNEVALRMAVLMGKPHLRPRVTGRYRVGDIRHCFADTSLAREALEFVAHVSLEEGMGELATWLRGRQAEDHVERATQELSRRGLTL